ncbi:MAG: TonB-dependent receptor [Gammaproteobacteria bacterium]|nr:TonB-dependent receptor [Gammaproteobacteria bacterium]
MKEHLAVIAVAGILLAPPALFAEEADEGSEDASRRQFEEIVVTAERRESTVQDTAIAITAFTGDFIADFGLRNQEDLQNYLPATTIQPYDLSIRGVGRLFRALGGDPGVATYFDGAYSEDFGIASTEGGLFDIERIEFLRGPQGTLYGRNGVGGAVNFHSKKPTDEFEGEVRANVGSFNTREVFGVVSGPVIEGVLNARANGVKRTRDGFMDDVQPGNPDINDYGDENYSLALEWLPLDNLSVLVRGNERSYRRSMSGAQGAGAIVISEQAGMRDPVTGGERWVSVPVHGWRPIADPTAADAPMCASATDRSVPNCIVPTGLVPYINDDHPWYSFTHNGLTRYAQPVVGGVDPVGLAPDGTTVSGFARPNYAYQAAFDPGLQMLADRSIQGDGRRIPELGGDDLRGWTNGLQDEFFDHQAAYMNVTWDVLDNLTVKYIGAYTDYFYHRTTDDDRTGMPIDQQFYAAQENENFQHEVQFFLDVGANLNFTGGYFYYENDIDQQLDFYSPDGWSRYTEPADYGVLGPTAYLFGAVIVPAWLITGDTSTNHRTAKELGKAGVLPNLAGAVPIPSFSDPSIQEVYFADNPWMGDTVGTGGRVDRGPASNGTTFIWDTENRTEAWAVYLQGEWQINDLFALTLGVRYAEDDKEAEESLFLYNEAPGALANCVNNVGVELAALCGDLDGDGAVTLAEYNTGITGGIDATGNIADFDKVRFRGVPFARSIYRSMVNDFDEITWRVNLDFTPNEKDLYYFSVTTGYRAGGFNLGYFSFIPTYAPEDLTAYELGYKGQLFDGTVQLNASAYLYDYDLIHLQFSTFSFTGVSTSVQNAPSAETIGFEFEGMWLVTDEITVGLNYSYTDASYNAELFEPTAGTRGVVDGSNALAPSSVFTVAERNLLIDGEPLPRVPKHKFTGWADYVQNLGNRGTVTYLTSVAWTDEFPAGGRPTAASPLSVAPAFLRWDARVSWTSLDRQWTVAGFVNNILDEIGVRNQFTYAESQGHRRVIEPTNPRWWGLEVHYKFGAYR